MIVMIILFVLKNVCSNLGIVVVIVFVKVFRIIYNGSKMIFGRFGKVSVI